MKILVTGAAGFIGSKVAWRLAGRGDEVVGLDNFNDYYDVGLKYARVKQFFAGPGLSLVRMDITDKAALDALFEREHFDKMVHLAAQAGVRRSIAEPYAYLQSNVAGFLNVLESCRNHGIGHLVYASSSSVYGANAKVPFAEDDKTDSPVSLYAATKKSNELMAYAYANLYGIATTGLRFFTAYGPWGRPDMAPMLFAKAIFAGEPIQLFNGGDMVRDFIYIDDLVEATLRCIDREPGPDENGVRSRVYNIGCSHPVKLTDFIAELEQAFGREARKEYLPMQPGDVHRTYADITRLETELGWKPQVSLHEGVGRFAEWYKDYCL